MNRVWKSTLSRIFWRPLLVLLWTAALLLPLDSGGATAASRARVSQEAASFLQAYDGFISFLPHVTGTSMIRVSNESTSETANVLFVAYNPDGTTNGSPFMDTISSLGTKTYSPLSWLSSGALVSLVISSNQPVVAVAAVDDALGHGPGFYQSLSQGATGFVFGPVFDNGSEYSHSTTLFVQNAGSQTANVSLTFTGIPTGTASAAFQVPSGSSKTTALVSWSGGGSASGIGVVRVASNQPVGVLAMHSGPSGDFTLASAPINAPMGAPRFLAGADDGVGSRSTVAVVASPLLASAALTSTFLSAGGAVQQVITQTIAPQGVGLIEPSGLAPVTALRSQGNPALSVGHVTLFDSQPITAYSGEYSPGWGNSIFVPGLRQLTNEYSIVAVQNPQASAVSATMHLYRAAGSVVASVPITIPAGGFYRASLLALPGAGEVTAAQIESDQSVVVWVDVLGKTESPPTPTETPTPTPTHTSTPTNTPTPTSTPTPQPSGGSLFLEPSVASQGDFKTESGQTLRITAPAGTVTDTMQLIFVSPVVHPPGGFNLGTLFFSITALQNGQPLEHVTFLKPVTFEIHYLDSDLVGLDEGELEVLFYDEQTGLWSNGGVHIVVRDAANNRLVMTITHLTTFGLSDSTQFLFLPAARRGK
jgi:hypothetical protein